MERGGTKVKITMPTKGLFSTWIMMPGSHSIIFFPFPNVSKNTKLHTDNTDTTDDH